MVAIPQTDVTVIPVPAAMFGVRSHVIVSVVISPSHEVLLALS